MPNRHQLFLGWLCACFQSCSYPVTTLSTRTRAEAPTSRGDPCGGSRTADIDGAVAAFAAQPGGITIPPDPFTVVNRTAILQLWNAIRHPHILSSRTSPGGLMRMGGHRHFPPRGDYTDRILKGAILFRRKRPNLNC
jgi:hypothetical protein